VRSSVSAGAQNPDYRLPRPPPVPEDIDVILRSPDPESRTADVAASLRSAGVLGNSEIASVTEERISSKGLMSVLTRITAEFAVQAPGTPGDADSQAGT
jgi:hypothetical protein